RCAGQVEQDFGMGVEVAPPGGDFGVELGDTIENWHLNLRTMTICDSVRPAGRRQPPTALRKAPDLALGRCDQAEMVAEAVIQKGSEVIGQMPDDFGVG